MVLELDRKSAWDRVIDIRIGRYGSRDHRTVRSKLWIFPQCLLLNTTSYDAATEIF